jgi:4-hydroxy-tetrahydrodipicolinate reductase
MIRVAIAGAGGRMGTEAVKAVTAAPDMELVAELRRGDDLSAALSTTRPDVLVELTVPDSAPGNIRVALEAGVVPVVGTTGFTPADLDDFAARCAARGIGCLIAPNFALGAVLLMRFAADAARHFPDVEIIELHHEKKRDAPSGTAHRTAERIAAARETAPIPPVDGAFESLTGARGGHGPGGIPIHSVRLPGFVASQEVLFGGPGQRLTLRHDSTDRASFMPGVLLAIRRAPALRGLVVGLEHLL